MIRYPAQTLFGCFRPGRLSWITTGLVVAAFASAAALVQAQPGESYYQSVDLSSAESLKRSLHDIIDDHHRLPYTSSAVDTLDAVNSAD